MDNLALLYCGNVVHALEDRSLALLEDHLLGATLPDYDIIHMINQAEMCFLCACVVARCALIAGCSSTIQASMNPA